MQRPAAAADALGHHEALGDTREAHDELEQRLCLLGRAGAGEARQLHLSTRLERREHAAGSIDEVLAAIVDPQRRSAALGDAHLERGRVDAADRGRLHPGQRLDARTRGGGVERDERAGVGQVDGGEHVGIGGESLAGERHLLDQQPGPLQRLPRLGKERRDRTRLPAAVGQERKGERAGKPGEHGDAEAAAVGGLFCGTPAAGKNAGERRRRLGFVRGRNAEGGEQRRVWF